MTDIYQELENQVVQYLKEKNIHIEFTLYKNRHQLTFIRDRNQVPERIAELRYDTTSGDILYDIILDRDMTVGNEIQSNIVLPLRDILLDNPGYFETDSLIEQISNELEDAFHDSRKKKQEDLKGGLSLKGIASDLKRLKKD